MQDFTDSGKGYNGKEVNIEIWMDGWKKEQLLVLVYLGGNH